MVYPDTAEGFMVHDQKNWQSFKKEEFKLKPFEDRDIDIAIECCGVCTFSRAQYYHVSRSSGS
jgi:alcohol dehydrogenase (NADP+)